MKSRKGISLVGINDTNTLKSISSAYPDAVFELSYLSTEETLKQQMPFIKNRINSVHMLCPMREYFPNLADRPSYQWSYEQIVKDAIYAAEEGARTVVLHPGYLVHGLLSTDYEKRAAAMKNANLDMYTISPDSNVCKPDYIRSRQYIQAFEIMTENLLKVSRKTEEYAVKLAAENLNPRAGYILMHPHEIVQLARAGVYINLDIGHLQVCSALFGFDLYEETEKILDTGMVRSMHLHSNESCNGVYKDSHCSFDRFIDYKKIIQLAENAGSDMILEVLEEPERNVSLLFPAV